MKKNSIKWVVLVIAFILILGAVLTWGVPAIKHKIFENKIRKSLLEAYPGADITRVKCGADPLTMDEFEESYGYRWYSDDPWPAEEMYVFEVGAGEGATPVLGLATEEGDVLFDEYAFYYYRDELQAYVMDIIDPEENFPGVEFEYHDMVMANESRLVPTDSCDTFEGFLDTDNVGVGSGNWDSMESAGCRIEINIDPYDHDTNMAVCQSLAEILTSADCQVYIDFTESYTGHGIRIGRYYTWELEPYGRFVPYAGDVQMFWNE